MARWSSPLGRAGPLIAARLVSATFSLSIPLVLARTLPLAEYGTYKQLWLVATLVGHVAPFGVHSSLYYFLPRAKAPRAWLGQTFAFMAAAGLVGGAVLWSAGPWVAHALSNPGLLEHARELAVFSALQVASAALEPSLTSRGHMRGAAATYLLSDGTRAAVLVIPSLTGLGLHGMMIGLAGHAAIRCAAAWLLVFAGERGPLFDRSLFRQQLAYALPFGLAIAFSIPQQYAHQFIVAHAVGPAVFALYAAGTFELPFVDLFYTPTGEVLMVQVGELDRSGRRSEAVHAFRDAVERLAALLLPPIFFIWAVAPTFIVTVFGPRFEGAIPIFRIALLVMPLAIWPIDAMLRARGETRHILRSYVVKAAISIPLAWFAVARLGLEGAVASYVCSEVLGRAFLAARLPASLGTEERRVRFRDLVPARALARIVLTSTATAGLGATTLWVASGLYGAGASVLRSRVLPLGTASAVFGISYLAVLAASNVRAPGALGALFGRKRPGQTATA